MSAGHDDILERLEVALNAWNVEIAQARAGLSAELNALGAHIAILPQLGPRGCPSAQPLAQDVGNRPAAEKTIQQLKARVAELDAFLKAARAKLEELERQARQPLQELGGEPESLSQRLADALRDRNEAHQEIVALRCETDLLRRANARLSAPVAPVEVRPGGPAEVFDADGRRRRLGEILLDLGLIDEAQLNEALAEQSGSPQRRLGAILVEKGVTSEDIVARILARQLGLPFVCLDGNVADPAAPSLVTSELAWSRECIPIAVSPTSLVLAMANPFNLIAIEEVELAAGRRVDPVVASAGDVRAALRRYYGSSDSQPQA